MKTSGEREKRRLESRLEGGRKWNEDQILVMSWMAVMSDFRSTSSAWDWLVAAWTVAEIDLRKVFVRQSTICAL